MSPQRWFTDPAAEEPVGRLLRGRWVRDSVYVLDIDRLICDPAGKHGLLIEEKKVNAPGRDWAITRSIAQRLGWWGALWVYDTDALSNVTEIEATFQGPDGSLSSPRTLDLATFDQWVCKEFGAKLNLAERPCLVCGQECQEWERVFEGYLHGSCAR